VTGPPARPSGGPPADPAAARPGGQGTGLAAGPGDAAVWHRLHPLSPLVRAARHVVTLLLALTVILIANQHGDDTNVIIDLVIIGLALVGGLISWVVTRWQLASGVLRVETGLIRRESRRFPLAQVQAIDVVQTGLARVLGLAELRLRMAGGDSSVGRLACLRLADAEQLRARLLALSHAPGAAGTGTPTAGAPTAPADTAGQPTPAERPLFRVRSPRLAGAILLSRDGAYALASVAVQFVLAAVTGGAGIAAVFAAVVVGFVYTVWHRFNAEFGTSVTEAPEGLRLRSGLVGTTAETIRPGRVQAVRLVEPLVWRAFGWCRLEVDVAGPRQRKGNQPESRRLRALIPVGSRAEAEQLIGELVSPLPRPASPAARSARWKAPLMYHFLGWGGNDRYVVASHGRVCRTTTWVPLEKAQSIRWVQGPVQRRLGLASVLVDVAGRRVTAGIRDRSAAEADEILQRLPAQARAARARVA
jgi:putative membrane protein